MNLIDNKLLRYEISAWKLVQIIRTISYGGFYTQNSETGFEQ